MLSDFDRGQMREDLVSVRGDRETAITIRRGSGSLPAQRVRITRAGGGRKAQGQEAEEAQIGALVFGPVDLDIQPGDRFTDGGLLYEITVVRPNRSASTVAEAVIKD